MAVAALIGIFGLAMLDLAVYFELEPKLGRVGAAAIVGFGDLILAAILFNRAATSNLPRKSRSRPSMRSPMMPARSRPISVG
jgi:hypothetical protein